MKSAKHREYAISLVRSSQKAITKFGGNPNLPPSILWPCDADGRNLDFLAQIHLSELPAGTGLPESGTLFVFYTDYGDWKIIYTGETLPAVERVPEPGDKAPWQYRESFRRCQVLRTEQCLRDPYHQMLGKPYCLQRSNMAPGYKLLLQLDSDLEENGPGWMWGDVGVIYFFIKPGDLAARCFDNIKFMRESC